MKRIAVLLFVFLACVSTFAAKEKEVAKVNKVMPFTKGLNLTGWLEGYDNSNWRSELFGRQDFEDIKSLGVEIVRIPIFQFSLRNSVLVSLTIS